VARLGQESRTATFPRELAGDSTSASTRVLQCHLDVTRAGPGPVRYSHDHVGAGRDRWEPASGLTRGAFDADPARHHPRRADAGAS
jgi:hypothetical protein